ncbi:MAG TPA: hypothetical protein VHO00_02240 [Actinomycetes bacterium]|jgi:hypothetical protein|nr:hypothetical protein [Actinomycetes bacterium]
MLIDCNQCSMRDIACPDCVVTVLLELPKRRIELDPDEQAALAVLAGSGLVPPLRLVTDESAGETPSDGCSRAARTA